MHFYLIADLTLINTIIILTSTIIYLVICMVKISRMLRLVYKMGAHLKPPQSYLEKTQQSLVLILIHAATYLKKKV